MSTPTTKATKSDLKTTSLGWKDIWEQGIPVYTAFLHATLQTNLIGAEMSLIPEKLKGAELRVDKDLKVLIIMKNGKFTGLPLTGVKNFNGEM